MRDNKTYTSSAFICLLRSKFNQDLLELSRVSKMTLKDIKEVQQGKRMLKPEEHLRLTKHIGVYIDVEIIGEWNEN